MARKCAICGKKGKMIWRRVKLRADKYNPTIKRKQYPNLQWVRIAKKRMLACTKCIKALGKK